MISKNRLASLVVSMAVLILLSCTGQESPFKAQDAKINLVLENSLNQLSTDAVTDTVGNQVRIGMSAHLPSYISLVTVTVTGGVPDPDVITFRNVSAWNDTQWIDLAFDSTGTKTVTVVVSRQGAPDLTYTANIIIVGRNVNHKPALSVSGVRNILSAQACSLSLSATDPDIGQTLTYAMTKGPQGATLTATIFRWTAPAALTGTDTATFTVTDNGKPPMSDTQTVFITVSSQIVAPVKVLGVKAVSKFNGYFILSWTRVSNADSYNIFRATDTINFQKIGSTSDSLFGDSVKSGNYYYYVVAVNTAGTSPASAMVYSGSIKTPPVIMVPTVDTSVAQSKTISFMVQAVASAQDTVVLSATDIAGGKLPDSAVFNAKTGIFTWTPTYGELGLYSIVFVAANGNAIAKDTVKITVTKTDRPPVVQAQSMNAGRDEATTITLVATDPDNDPVTQWQITQKPHSGTAVLADSTKASIVYTPNSGFIGADTFAVKAYDGTLWSAGSANVIITVDSSKVAPTIQKQPRQDTTVNQGGSVTFTVAINNAFPTPTFTWFKGAKGSTDTVQTGTNGQFQIKTAAVSDSGNYYVIVSNSSGSIASDYAHLTVNALASVPTLVSPANGVSGLPVSLTLLWNKVAGTSAYYVQVASDAGFATILVSDSTQTDTTMAISGCVKGTTYYWHVMARNAIGKSAWSASRSFATIRQFALTVAAANGTVTQTPNAAQYDSGTVVGLKAHPTSGYQFVNWSGDATGTEDSAMVVMNGTKNVTVNFSVIQYQLTVTAATGGTITAPATSPATVNSGAATTITAVPNNGYSFAGWTVTSGTATLENAGSATTTVTLSSGNSTVTANFMSITNSLAVVAGTGGTITAPATSPVTVTYGVPTTITTAPIAGYTFVNWTVTSGTATITSPTSLSTTVTISGGSAAVTANFAKITYTLTVTPGTGGTATPTTPTTVNYGDATAITATPSAGYSFVNWTVTGTGATVASVNNASTTVILTGGNATVTANFTKITYTLTVTPGTGGTATPTTPTTVNYGDATTITATPNTGYSFVNWTVTGTGATVANANNASTTVTLTGGNATVTANFTKITYTLTVTPGTGGTATPTTPTTVNYGDATAITATPSTGYKFVNWTVTAGTGATIASSTSTSTTVSLTGGPATVTANFQALSCSWTNVQDYSSVSNNAYSISASGDTVLVGLRKYGIDESINNGTSFGGSIGPFGSPAPGYIYAVAKYGSLILGGQNNSSGYTSIFSTLDNGSNWNTFAAGSSANTFAQGNGTFFAGTDAGAYNSTDGIGWNTDGASTLTGSVRAILVSGTTIYATSNGSLYYRTTSGYTWYSISGGPTGIISLFSSGGNDYAGTGSGLYKHASDWVTTGNAGLPVSVSIIGYAVSGNKFFAGTAANGVYCSTDNGANWFAVNGGFPGGGSTPITAIAANTNSVFVISNASVVFKSPLP